MSEEMQKKLFTPFEQERDGIMRNNSGTGLGMSITKSMVSMMNGKITFKSKYGVGTTFDVNLLLSYEEKKLEDEKPQEIDLKGKEMDFQGKRVLLAEDNAINAEIATILLGKVNLRVDLAKNGRIALDKFRAHPSKDYYAVIMMDIQMPEMDGYEATKAIRSFASEWAKDIPIIAITANAFSEDVAMAASVGMNDHVSKPIDKNMMYKVLSRYI